MRSDIALFGLKNLLSKQDGDEYGRLLVAVTEAYDPADVLEEIWVRELVDNIYEIHRLRLGKEALVMASLPSALLELLAPIYGTPTAAETIKQWKSGSEVSGLEIQKYLKALNVTEDSVRALAIAEQMDSLERFDKLIDSAERRRRAYYQDIEKHRGTRTDRTHQALDRASKELELKAIGKSEGEEAA